MAKDYNEAIKISKRIRDAKKTLESSVSELAKEDGEVKKYLQTYPRKPTKPVEVEVDKDDYESKESYQKVKKLREVVVFAIEKALDDLHFIMLKLDEVKFFYGSKYNIIVQVQNKEEILNIAQIARSLLQVFAADEPTPTESQLDTEGVTTKTRKAIENEADMVTEKIKDLKARLESSSMEKAVDIARSIRYVKKDLQDFFNEQQLALPPEVQPAPTPGEDKFLALKKMMLSTLERIQTQAAILKKEAGSSSDNADKIVKILEKLSFINKSFSN